MNRLKAQQLTLTLMHKHGLVGWNFNWARAKTILGHTRHSTSTISLSTYFVDRSDESAVTNTILHEIAHALVGPGHGHDLAWKSTARRIGCVPRRTSKVEYDAREAAPWVPVCPVGHRGEGFLRAPGRVRACRICCKGKFSNAHRMTWEFNGRKQPLSAMPVKYQREWIAQDQRG